MPPNTFTTTPNFRPLDLVPEEDDEETSSNERECDCPFPWWWLVLAAAAGGGIGYYAGRKSAEPDEELPLEP